MKWLGHLVDQPAQGIEIGTWKGEMAEAIMDHILTNPACNLYCIDTFAGSPEHHLAGIDCTMIETEARKRLERFSFMVKIAKSRSHTVLRAISGELADFVYVDAGHDSQNVLRDSVLAFDLLKVGGVLIWDDYAWNVFPEPTKCPKIAIDAFLACYANQIELLGMGWQVAVKKTA